MNPKRPLIRYHGGKWRLPPWIIRHLPPHRCYVEPFGGAAGVPLQKDRAYAEVYNDLDGDIVNLFRMLRDAEGSSLLIALIGLTPYSRDEFDDGYEPHSDPVERARRTIIRSSMGFGSAGATKGTTGFRIDTRRRCGTALQLWAEYPASVGLVIRRLAGMMIENRPALDLIRQHDAPNTLFFVCPPYLDETRSAGARLGRYYAHEMSDLDYVELWAMLRQARGMVMLSGYPRSQYEITLAGWSSTSTAACISPARGSEVRTEYLWFGPAWVDALNYADRLFAEAV